MKPWWYLAFGLLGGLLGAGLIWLVASPPRGPAVRLRPAPTAEPLAIHVVGEVRNPGLFQLPPGSRVAAALQAAGGTRPEADTGALNLAARLEDGDQVRVPALLPGGASPGQSSTAPAAQDRNPAEAEDSGIKININQATSQELERLPGIGPATAAKIVAYRQDHGPFKNPQDIQNVSGIGPATYERIKAVINVD